MKKTLSITLILILIKLLCQPVYAHQPGFYLLLKDSLKNSKDLSDVYWKYDASDDSSYAMFLFDDSKWSTILPSLKIDSNTEKLFKGIIWFRLHITVDSVISNRLLCFSIEQFGASEIYLDGKLIKRLGQPATNKHSEVTMNPQGIPIGFFFSGAGEHIIAIRYSNHRAVHNFNFFSDNERLGGVKEISIHYLQSYAEYMSNTMFNNTSIFMSVFGFLLALSMLHLFLFLYYRAQKANLYYSLFAFSLGILFLLFNLNMFVSSTNVLLWANSFLIRYIMLLLFFSLMILTNSLYYSSIPKKFWIYTSLIVLFIIGSFSMQFRDGLNIYLLFSIMASISVTSIITIIKLIRQRKEGAWIIGTGVIIFGSIIFYTSIYLLINDGIDLGGYTTLALMLSCILSIPISMSLYLAKGISLTNKNLQKQLLQVENLSAQTIAQEQEKQHILETQKERLEIQVQERTAEVVEQKEEIEAQRDEMEKQKLELEERNKEITDSITYARRIQRAILPPDAEIKQHLPNSFVLYKPKDIVAGDFYWLQIIDEWLFIAAADCTGHGVPGALVSVVCSNALNSAVKEFGITEPGRILDKVTELVVETFAKSDSDVKDGMDISLLAINRTHKLAHWSGAHNPLWIVNNELHETKADKQPIGKSEQRKPFTTHIIQIHEGDTIYLFSDGYADQFGGTEGKKLMTKRFKEILINIQHLDLAAQEAALNNTFEEWKGKHEQVDDVLIIGVRV